MYINAGVSKEMIGKISSSVNNASPDALSSSGKLLGWLDKNW